MKTININRLYAWKPKVSQTLEEISHKEFSYCTGVPLLVSRFKRAWFILDGHHRAIEALNRGESTIQITQCQYTPNMEHGNGFSEMLSDTVKLVDVISQGENHD